MHAKQHRDERRNIMTIIIGVRCPLQTLVTGLPLEKNTVGKRERERETNRIICYRLFLPGTVAVQPRTKSEGGCSNGLMGARALRRFGPSRQTDDTLHVQRSLFGLLLSFRRSSSPSSIASCLQLQPVTCSTAVRSTKERRGAISWTGSQCCFT
jgi:hypothetical protein